MSSGSLEVVCWVSRGEFYFGFQITLQMTTLCCWKEFAERENCAASYINWYSLQYKLAICIKILNIINTNWPKNSTSVNSSQINNYTKTRYVNKDVHCSIDKGGHNLNVQQWGWLNKFWCTDHWECYILIKMMMEIKGFDKEECLLIVNEESTFQNHGLAWPKSPLIFFCKIKDTFFIFTNNFIYLDVLSMSAISHYWF